MIMNNKRGASSHLEMILSFVLFISFFFFVIIFLQPYETNVLTTSIVDGAYYNFMEYTTDEITTFSIKINDPIEECFTLRLNEVFQEYDTSFVYDEEDNLAESTISGEYLRVNNEDSKSFFDIILVKDMTKEIVTINCPNEIENYLVGGTINEKIISYQKIEELKNQYDSDYKSLKNVFAVPGRFDFAINSNLINLDRSIPDNVRVMAKSYNERVLLENGTIINVEFIIRAW